MDSELLNTVEAAEFIRQRPRLLEAWRYRGEGPPYIKTHHSVRYRKSDLVAWLDAKRIVPERDSAAA